MCGTHMCRQNTHTQKNNNNFFSKSSWSDCFHNRICLEQELLFLLFLPPWSQSSNLFLASAFLGLGLASATLCRLWRTWISSAHSIHPAAHSHLYSSNSRGSTLFWPLKEPSMNAAQACMQAKDTHIHK